MLKKIVSGANTFARVVCATHGPLGRTVMLDRAQGLLSTKDGVTVAREVGLSDPIENIACQVLKQACLRVNNRVGDGTTTTACISAAMLNGALPLIEANCNIPQLLNGMKQATKAVPGTLPDLVYSVSTREDLEAIARISCNGDEEIATNIAEAILSVGKNGNVSIEDGQSTEITLAFKEGLEIDRGAVHHDFLKERLERVFENPLVACVATTISRIDDIREVLECSTQYGRPLVLFVDQIDDEALKTMLLNDRKGVLPCVAIQTPGFLDKAERLQDIATITGGVVVHRQDGLQSWDAERYGVFASKITVRLKSTLIEVIPEAAESSSARAQVIRGQANLCTSDYDRERMLERAAALEGGLCIMQIGGVTEAELKEKRARVEDALNSVQNAMKHGQVPGAGMAYLAVSNKLKELMPEGQHPDFVNGWEIVARAFQEPFISINNQDGHKIIGQVLNDMENFGWYGWHPLRSEMCDLLESGICDPANVLSEVADAAYSVVFSLLSSGKVIHYAHPD